VHGRDAGRGEGVVRDIRQAGGEAEFIAADVASLAQVRGLAASVANKADRLDLLINNAGIGSAGPGRQVSADGHELRFAVNYLAGFLLASMLRARLEASAPARIVNVASAGQQAIDFDDVMLEHGYDGGRAYCQSKLAQIMHAFDLAEDLAGRGVTATALHPATFMDTKMVIDAGVSPASTVQEGLEATWRLVADPSVEGVTGAYFNGTREARADAQAYDLDARRRLRELSERLVDA